MSSSCFSSCFSFRVDPIPHVSSVRIHTIPFLKLNPRIPHSCIKPHSLISILRLIIDFTLISHRTSYPSSESSGSVPTDLGIILAFHCKYFGISHYLLGDLRDLINSNSTPTCHSARDTLSGVPRAVLHGSELVAGRSLQSITEALQQVWSNGNIEVERCTHPL